MILIFMVGGAREEISFCIRSAIPGNMVVPPDKTVLAYKSLRISTSLHDRVVGGLMDSARFHSNEGGLEEGFGASEPLVANGDDLAIRQFIGFFQTGAGGCCLHLGFVIQSDIAQLLLDVTQDYE